ncbi:hypothetical protein NL676_030940 [Syzygium grande]|nr:hypothetical protein NL676_030940 [Syzygium grande]
MSDRGHHPLWSIVFSLLERFNSGRNRHGPPPKPPSDRDRNRSMAQDLVKSTGSVTVVIRPVHGGSGRRTASEDFGNALTRNAWGRGKGSFLHCFFKSSASEHASDLLK